MKRIYKFIPLWFALIVILSGCVKSNSDTKPSEEINLKEYTVVLAESKSSSATFAAQNLRSALKSAYGTDIPVVIVKANDTSEAPENQKEILIGATNRNFGAEICGSLGEYDYYLGYDGTNILIAGGSDDALETAVKTFINTYVTKESESLKIPKDLNMLSKFQYSEYYKTDSSANGEVLVYDAPKDAILNNDSFTLAVKVNENWLEVPVYAVKIAWQREYHDYVINNGSFASIDFSGSVEVCVKSNRNISDCKIRPDSDEIKYTQEGNSIYFTVSEPCQLSIEINGDIYNNLQFFANEKENDIPDPNDENVIFVTPGVHTVDNTSYITYNSIDGNDMPVIQLKSNQTLYIAGGAVVKAKVEIPADASNIKICGRGIIDLVDWNGANCTFADTNGGPYPCGIKLYHCSDISISGVIIKNSCSYVIFGGACNNVDIDNVKCFACSEWSDGIDMMASSNITIRNSFIRTCDDCIAIYATRWDNYGDSIDWKIINNVLWGDTAHAVNIGTHGSQVSDDRDTISDLYFEDIDILEVNCLGSDYWGTIAFSVGDENIVRNATFKNIRVDDFTLSEFLSVKIQQNSEYNPVPGYLIENILFQDITYNGQNKNKSHVDGYSPERLVKNVVFDKVIINGKHILDANEGNFEIGKYTEDIVFK